MLVSAQRELGKGHESTKEAALKLAQLLEARGAADEAANVRSHFALPEKVSS